MAMRMMLMVTLVMVSAAGHAQEPDAGWPALEVCRGQEEVAAARAKADEAHQTMKRGGPRVSELALEYGNRLRVADQLEGERQTCLTRNSLEQHRRDQIDQERNEAAARQAREEQWRLEREEKARIESEREERIKALLHEPRSVKLILSTLLCSARADEAEALNDIRQEKANSKIAGVVDLSLLRSLQDQVVESRALQKSWKQQLAAKQLSAASCADPAIKTITGCWLRSECGDAETKDLADAVGRRAQ